MNSAAYIKIALFFLILGGIGIGYIALSTNGVTTANSNVYDAIFPDATGISRRSRVYLSGIGVGRVYSIWLDGTEPRIRFIVRKNLVLHQDAAIIRQPSSVLGTAELSLYLGSDKSPVAPPGSLIKSSFSSGEMSAAVNTVYDVGTQLNLILEEYRLNQMDMLTISLETFNSIMEKYNDRSEAQLDDISRILESTVHITEITRDLLQDRENEILGSFDDLHQTLTNIRNFTGDERFNSILASFEKTEGVMEEISNFTKTADILANNVNETINKTLGIQVDTNARYDIRAQTTRASASIRFEPPASNDRWYRIGFLSSPDSNASRTKIFDASGNLTGYEDTTTKKFSLVIDAELARRFGMVTLRGGIFENSAGVGLDIQPFKWVSVSGEIFEFTNKDVPNLRGIVTFYPLFDPNSKKLWNWIYIRGGINNILGNDRDIFLSTGLRFADRDVLDMVGRVPLN